MRHQNRTHQRAIAHLLPLTLVLGLATSAAANDLFDAPVHYAVGTHPRDISTADLNGDGRLDLVVANEVTGAVSVLLNDGFGTFQPQSLYFVAGHPLALTTAAMDADAFPDVIISNSDNNSISVLVNNGDGSLAPPADYAVGNAPWGVISVDLNGDQWMDVAVVNRDSDNFSVLLNNGDGTLAPAGTFPAGGAYISPSWLTPGRFNEDEYPDIAVVKNYHNLYFNEGYVQVFINDGTGSFSSTQTITIGPRATTPVAADFDGDSDVDLGISGFVDSSYKLSILLNDGTGTFADPVAYYAGASGRAAGGDFDCDGDVDIVISEEGVYSYSFSVLLNNGDGTFADAFAVATGADPMGITGGDFDGDCDLDVAVAVMDENTVAVARNLTDPVAGVPGRGLSDLVSGLQLRQNYPNPFASSTVVRYMLPEATTVRLAVFDSQGRLARVLVQGIRGSGAAQATWDGRDGRGHELPSGLYLYRLEADGFVEQRGMVLLR